MRLAKVIEVNETPRMIFFRADQINKHLKDGTLTEKIVDEIFHELCREMDTFSVAALVE